MAWFRRFVILSHRYLGIALSLIFIVWFASGITMMWWGGMPRLTADERLERLPALDLRTVRIAPGDAEQKVGGGRTTLLNVMGRPAYRIGGPDAVTLFADTGEVLETVTPVAATGIAAKFMSLPDAQVHLEGTIDRPDQWTLGQSRQMPLHKFTVDDPLGTELYVSANLGEVTVMTTRRSRTLAWLGTIPHWFYFAALRNNQPVWYQVVVWTSGIGCVVALLGLILGATQYRWSRPRRAGATGIPYSGWMRWHYITGVIFGVFTLTWAFSGLLSMEPFGWATNPGLQIPRDAFTGGNVELARFPAMDSAKWEQLMEGRPIKEVEFVRIQDEPYYVVRTARDSGQLASFERLHQPYNVTGRRQGQRLIVAAGSLSIRPGPFSADSLVARLKQAAPQAPIVEARLLDDYDSYYYSRGRQTPLPILRVKFDDPDQTWVYVDPEMSQVVARIHRLDRVERWLYNGLHSLDFSFWYNRRPLWDIGVLTLMLGGLASSVIGLCLGVKRLRRSARQAAKSLAGAPTYARARSTGL
ncbi:MAG: PepSY domain-containing protein [Acidobacteriota bacterium]